MSRLRSLLRWVFVRGPAGFYELAESGSWLLSVLVVVGLILVAGLGAGIGALIALATGQPLSPAVDTGMFTALLALIGWFALSIVVVGVLWARGVTPGEAYAGQSSERHAAGSPAGWRRRGDALVPASLVGFFALMTVAFGALGVHAWQTSRPWSEPTAVVEGAVVTFHKPGLLDKRAGSVVVRYTVDGSSHTLEIGADTGDRFLKVGDALPVEYAINRPSHARAIPTIEAGRSDARFWGGLSALGAVLGAASGIAYLIGRRRRRVR